LCYDNAEQSKASGCLARSDSWR